MHTHLMNVPNGFFNSPYVGALLAPILPSSTGGGVMIPPCPTLDLNDENLDDPRFIGGSGSGWLEGALDDGNDGDGVDGGREGIDGIPSGIDFSILVFSSPSPFLPSLRIDIFCASPSISA
jgi:hypothetical protein